MALPDTFKLMIYGTDDEDSGEVSSMEAINGVEFALPENKYEYNKFVY